MEILNKLDQARSKPIVYYHKFISSYKKDSNDIYVFCEGDVDLNYYCELIERKCPGIVIHKCPAECKSNVLQIWGMINWNYYQKNRVLFFVDRDLSYWVHERQSYDSNVYITDGYSFENDAISSHMFLKLLEDLYGFAKYTPTEKERIKDFYNKKWEAFLKGSYDLMGYILYKYQYENVHTAKKLKIHNCIYIESDSVWKERIKGVPANEYCKKQLEIGEEDITEIINGYKKRFINEHEHYSIRGKWCIEFMIILMNYILASGESFAPSLYIGETKKPKKLLELTDRGAMATIGPKIIPPKSLITFLTENI